MSNPKPIPDWLPKQTPHDLCLVSQDNWEEIQLNAVKAFCEEVERRHRKLIDQGYTTMAVAYDDLKKELGIE